MRDFHDVKILRGVTHVVAPRSPQLLLQLSEAELPLGQGVGDILAAHVDMGLHDVQAKAATFVARRDDDACGILERLLSSRPRLVDLADNSLSGCTASPNATQRVTDALWPFCCARQPPAMGIPPRFPVDPQARPVGQAANGDRH